MIYIQVDWLPYLLTLKEYSLVLLAHHNITQCASCLLMKRMDLGTGMLLLMRLILVTTLPFSLALIWLHMDLRLLVVLLSPQIASQYTHTTALYVCFLEIDVVNEFLQSYLDCVYMYVVW